MWCQSVDIVRYVSNLVTLILNDAKSNGRFKGMFPFFPPPPKNREYLPLCREDSKWIRNCLFRRSPMIFLATPRALINARNTVYVTLESFDVSFFFVALFFYLSAGTLTRTATGINTGPNTLLARLCMIIDL